MNRTHFAFLLGAIFFGAAAPMRAPCEAGAPPPEDQTTVAGKESFWRYHAAWRTPATVTDNGKVDLGGGYGYPEKPNVRWIRDSFSYPTPPPPAGWIEPDFDDSGWPRHVGAPLAGYGYGDATNVYLLCGRLRFVVERPEKAEPVKLILEYRGGAVVYLNGKEVARAHLPAGELTATTLASDYPKEAFFDAAGKPLRSVSENRGPQPDLADRYHLRFRRLSVALPPSLLRKGTNVLAVRVHRAALPAAHQADAAKGWNPRSGKGAWGTCGVNQLAIYGPTASGLAASMDLIPEQQVWTCDSLLRPGVDFDHGDPLEPLRPIRLAAPQNGVASGQVAITAEHPLDRVSAKLGEGAGGRESFSVDVFSSGLPVGPKKTPDPFPPRIVQSYLESEAGQTVPAEAIEIRYATADAKIPQLLEKPPAGATILPIWLTVRVPKETPAGLYRGALEINGLTKRTSIPVELTVYDFTLPDVGDLHTTASLLHCPEAIARRYQAPLWSDRHFDLMAESMKLMAYGGNTILCAPVLAEHWFGDYPLLVFRKEGGKYAPDFRYVRRYLELYDKIAGPPRYLSLQVWNYDVSRRGFGRDGGDKKWMCDTITVGLLDGDKIVRHEMPVYTRPGTEETWAAVAAGAREIMRELKWDDTQLLWGTGGDNLPTAEIAAFFRKIDPDAMWRVATHGGSVRDWGETREQRQQAGGVIVGHASVVRRNITWRPLYPDCALEAIKRDGVASVATDYLTMAPLARIAANYGGVAFLNFDSWAIEVDGKLRSPIGAYTRMGNIHPSGGPFVAPGPNGAAPSPQLEAFREGLQVTEAILRIQAALADEAQSDKIDEETAAAAKAAIQTLMDVMESNRAIRPAGTADLTPHVRRIYELAEALASMPEA